ncbi:hypothetical protein HYX00_04475 [Candidatus Woesearchaeota archaeon]|nr:hypothetical protein [Candidatus Woesearchaeota archaeon]
MFIIDDVISWIVGKIMNKFFSNKKENEELIQLRNERIRLNQKIDQLEGEKEAKTTPTPTTNETTKTKCPPSCMFLIAHFVRLIEMSH